MAIKREKYVNFLLKQKDKDIVKILGVTESHIIKIALDNIKNEALLEPHKLYQAIEEKIKDQEMYYIFLDEIQLVDKFENVVNGIKNDFKCDLYITGSNSEFLSSDINTKFRGRGMELRVHPFSFSEMYEVIGGDKYQAFNQYMLYGGMPYLVQEDDPLEKDRYLRMVAEVVEINDIIDRHNIRNKEAFEAVVRLLCSSIGSYVSSKKIADTLKSNGFATIDHKTVGNYLSYLCDAFLFYKVDRYDIKGKAYLKTLNKYYVCDLGLRNALLNFRQIEPTHTIENIVYMELIERGYMVDIGNNNNKEIDFLVKDMKDTYYIQVSYSIQNQETKERELGSFRNLDDGYKKILITMDNDPFTNLEYGYKKLNMLDFLLDENSLQNV